MSCPNLPQNSLISSSTPTFERKHLTKFVRRIGSIICLILLDSIAMAGAAFVAAALLNDLPNRNFLLNLGNERAISLRSLALQTKLRFGNFRIYHPLARSLFTQSLLPNLKRCRFTFIARVVNKLNFEYN